MIWERRESMKADEVTMLHALSEMAARRVEATEDQGLFDTPLVACDIDESEVYSFTTSNGIFPKDCSRSFLLSKCIATFE